MRIRPILLFIVLLPIAVLAQKENMPYVMLLGITQDGGYPHIGCQRKCCQPAIIDKSKSRNVIALAIVSPTENKWWLVEATPNITEQLQLFSNKTLGKYPYLPEGIFITHAHMGHYTGLTYLGREALGAKEIPVYVMSKMKSYLETNGPWSQLVQLKNIAIHELTADKPEFLNSIISITPFLVPHRDEFSETAGFTIQAGKKKYLFIPDINKWTLFNRDIVEEVRKADIAFLDATFYSAEELAYRNITEVPHPFVRETMDLFKNAGASIKQKIVLIHFNHTNPLLSDPQKIKLFNKEGVRIGIQAAAY